MKAYIVTETMCDDYCIRAVCSSEQIAREYCVKHYGEDWDTREPNFAIGIEEWETT